MGFEPTRPLGQTVFKTGTINRSDTSPSASLCLTRSIIISSVFDNVNTFLQLFSRFFILFSIFACFSFIYRHFKLLFSCFFSFKIQINIVFYGCSDCEFTKTKSICLIKTIVFCYLYLHLYYFYLASNSINNSAISISSGVVTFIFL